MKKSTKILVFSTVLVLIFYCIAKYYHLSILKYDTFLPVFLLAVTAYVIYDILFKVPSENKNKNFSVLFIFCLLISQGCQKENSLIKPNENSNQKEARISERLQIEDFIEQHKELSISNDYILSDPNRTFKNFGDFKSWF